MPKDKSEQSTEGVAQFDFVLRSLTLTDVSKVPGAERYSSREFGVPFATFELGWAGRVRVPERIVDDLGGVDDLRDLETIGLAVKKLMRWLKGTGMEIGREIVCDIGLDRADAALGDVSNTDMDL